jgi:hypothetical protein
LRKYVDFFFAIASDVDTFVICGGEPLLHNELHKIIHHIGRYRANILSRLQVITNGTILPNPRVVNALKQTNACVLVDDYGVYSSKAKAVYDLLCQHNIVAELRANNETESHYAGWLSYDFNPQDDKIFPHGMSATKMFAGCLSANELRCNPIMNGKIYVCTPQEHLEHLGVIPQDSGYTLDLNKSLSTDDTINFLNLIFLNACEYCKGWRKETGTRYTPAEQL